MSLFKTLADKFKAAPSVSDVSGKRLLVIDANGNPSQASLANPITGLKVDNLSTKQLTNEDLNTIKDVNFSSYYAAGNNTCSNKPSEVTGFNLTVYGYSGTGCCQIITSTSGDYKRKWTGSAWSAWKKMLTEDDIASLVSRIAALEAKVS